MDKFLYGNVGGGIKLLAVISFFVEAFAAMASGVSLVLKSVFDGELIYILYGFLLILLGPIVAWIGSWFMYAFGELVEKTVLNEKHTREILEMMRADGVSNVGKANFSQNRATQCSQKKVVENIVGVEEPTKEEEYKFSPDGKYALTQRNTIICMACNFEQSNYRKKCWKCGAEFVDFGSFDDLK